MTRLRFLSRIFRTPQRTDGFARFTHVVAVTSVALGSLALIIALSVLGGYGKLMDETAERLGMPIVIKPLFSVEFSDAQSIAERTSTVPGVDTVVLMTQRQALIRANGIVDGAVLVGVPYLRAERLAPLIRAGSMPNEQNPSRICIGATLARRMSLTIGDTALIYAASGAGDNSSPVMRPAVVGGVFQSGMDQHDAMAVLVAETTLRSWLRLADNQASAIGVGVQADVDRGAVAELIRQRVGPSGMVQTPREQYASMEAWIALQREPIPIVLGLMSVVALFAVVAALLIAATTKLRHIAILRTLGATSGTITVLILLHSLRVSVTGSMLGSTIAYTLLLLQQQYRLIQLDGAVYYVSVLPVQISVEPLLVVGGTAIVVGALASLAPAAIALRVRPAAVLQFR